MFKILIVGVVLFFAQTVYAGNYKVLILPDNIVTENAALDSFICDSSSEFFANEIASILNETDNIEVKQVSEVRTLLKNNPAAMITAKKLTTTFKTSYNIDYGAIKKLAARTNDKYVLLLTSTIDAENYILRRTWWDFFNISGASVIDPAYKINTYAVLIDAEKNRKLWADTYYKTISVVENRIITRGYSPQTEQLAKIKDYSRYICPQIAKNVQIAVLPPDVFAKESNVIDYDIGNIDNIFTKKYRHIGKESGKLYNQKKVRTQKYIKETKARYNEAKAAREEAKRQAQLEVEAKKVNVKEESVNEISNTIKRDSKMLKSAVYQIEENNDDQTLFEPIEIKNTRKNNLFGKYDYDKPSLRDYWK